MAKTGLVPLPKKNVDTLPTTSSEEEDDTAEEPAQSNLGGLAQARRPGWNDWSVGNITQRTKPNRNRKPVYRDPDDDDEIQYIKRKQHKQGSGLPWFFNLVGPPG